MNQDNAAPLAQTEVAVVRLPETLDHAAAPALAAELAAHRGEAVAIDASATRFVGGQCLQVLLAAARAWRADDVAFDFHDLTPDLIEQSRLLGVDFNLLAHGELPQ